MKPNMQRLANSGPSLDTKAPPDQQRGQLLTFLGLSPEANDDDVRALVDAILTDAQAADPNADSNADPNATPQDAPADPSAMTYRIVDGATLSTFSVRLSARELVVCNNNKIPPARYARAKLHMHRDRPNRGTYGIRLLEGGGGQ